LATSGLLEAVTHTSLAAVRMLLDLLKTVTVFWVLSRTPEQPTLHHEHQEKQILASILHQA
jgi:hypothetical protein